MMETKSIKTTAVNSMPPKSGARPADGSKSHVITITLKKSLFSPRLKACRLDLTALDCPVTVDWT